MAIIFRNPNLPDYFVEHQGPDSLVDDYEAGKVITLPFLKLDIDTDFWASLPVDTYPDLKKLSAAADGGDSLAHALGKADIPADIAAAVKEHGQKILDQALPVYEKLFEGYEFVRRKVVWRLTTTLNEAMHTDTYKKESKLHFARMFINLDNQPRIWKTGYTLDELSAQFGDQAHKLISKPSGNRFHTKLKDLAFGEQSEEWWDNHPRHVVYFEPGEAWVVDSRQVAHQIFYGRRAVSIDFFVDRDSMQDMGRHYLLRAKKYMRKLDARAERAAEKA